MIKRAQIKFICIVMSILLAVFAVIFSVSFLIFRDFNERAIERTLEDAKNNFVEMTDTEIEIGGRHDATIIPRACVVAESLSAIVVADLLIGRYGTDYLLS